MKRKLNKQHILFAALTIGVIALAAVIIIATTGAASTKVAVGHSGGPMLGVLYSAGQDNQFAQDYEIVRFGSSSDVGYALLTGSIDAGFVETSKIAALEKLAGFEELTAVGEISFPYGATVILRKGLRLRLSELGGHTVGISSPNCELLAAFQEDAERLGADLSGVTYVTVPFEDMLSALEAGTVDAVVTKCSYTASMQEQGHTVLYQNWDVEAGDACCPAIIEQAQFVLLVRRDSAQAALKLPQQLLELQQANGADKIREAIAKETVIPLSVLSELPVAEFSLADDTLIEALVGHTHPEGEGHDDEEEEHADEQP